MYMLFSVYTIFLIDFWTVHFASEFTIQYIFTKYIFSPVFWVFFLVEFVFCVLLILVVFCFVCFRSVSSVSNITNVSEAQYYQCFWSSILPMFLKFNITNVSEVQYYQCFWSPILPMFLNCPFCIASSVFFNVYFLSTETLYWSILGMMHNMIWQLKYQI
jgi:hypothetical protein